MGYNNLLHCPNKAWNFSTLEIYVHFGCPNKVWKFSTLDIYVHFGCPNKAWTFSTLDIYVHFGCPNKVWNFSTLDIYVHFGCPNMVWKFAIFKRLTIVLAELAVKSFDILLDLVLIFVMKLAVATLENDDMAKRDIRMRKRYTNVEEI